MLRLPGCIAAFYTPLLHCCAIEESQPRRGDAVPGTLAVALTRFLQAISTAALPQSSPWLCDPSFAPAL